MKSDGQCAKATSQAQQRDILPPSRGPGGQDAAIHFLRHALSVIACIFFFCLTMFHTPQYVSQILQLRPNGRLIFDADRRFLISIFEDLHFGESKTPTPTQATP